MQHSIVTSFNINTSINQSVRRRTYPPPVEPLDGGVLGGDIERVVLAGDLAVISEGRRRRVGEAALLIALPRVALRRPPNGVFSAFAINDNTLFPIILGQDVLRSHLFPLHLSRPPYCLSLLCSGCHCNLSVASTHFSSVSLANSPSLAPLATQRLPGPLCINTTNAQIGPSPAIAAPTDAINITILVALLRVDGSYNKKDACSRIEEGGGLRNGRNSSGSQLPFES
ncbi:hypothetical protein BHE74_00013497 [Ensete ventricosum]|nr:hypothetical protein BHE74_00013497 [Ensete ventricosum]